MKHIILTLLLTLSAISLFAETKLNTNPDALIGEYFVPDAKNGDSKVKFYKAQDGTYTCQVFWLAIPNDPATGKPWLDTKNPDKSLRSRRSDSLILVTGLKYNADKQQWDGAKIYDPNRGIKVNFNCKFISDTKLQMRGSVLGIGETQIWDKLK